MIGTKTEHVKFLICCHWDAFQLAEFLATEGVWFEFVPHDDDRYIVAVQPNMDSVVVSRLNQWGVFVERMP